MRRGPGQASRREVLPLRGPVEQHEVGFKLFLHGLWTSGGASGDAWSFDELVALQVPGLVHLEWARFLWF